MEHLIDKSALVAELERRIKETESMQLKFDQFWAGQISAFKGVLKILDSLEVKEVNEVPATIMVNKYGNRFISSWPGLKEYDDFKKGEEIKIVILKNK